MDRVHSDTEGKALSSQVLRTTEVLQQMVDKIPVCKPKGKEQGVDQYPENELHWRFYTDIIEISPEHKLVLPNTQLVPWCLFNDTTREDELGEHYDRVDPF